SRPPWPLLIAHLFIWNEKYFDQPLHNLRLIGRILQPCALFSQMSWLTERTQFNLCWAYDKQTGSAHFRRRLLRLAVSLLRGELLRLVLPAWQRWGLARFRHVWRDWRNSHHSCRPAKSSERFAPWRQSYRHQRREGGRALGHNECRVSLAARLALFDDRRAQRPGTDFRLANHSATARPFSVV